MSYIKLENIIKEYKKNDIVEKVLKKVNLEIKKGEFIIIIGPSGSGKTSLLNIIGALDDLTDGNIIVNSKKINELSERKLIKYRRNEIGFVFQNYEFIENLTVLENIELGTQSHKALTDTKDIIKKIGLSKKEDYYPYELSCEEKQLLAIGMAISKKPNILLCDEPLNNLDAKAKKQVLKLFENLSKKEKTTIIMTNRNDDIISTLARVINIKNGTVTEKKKTKKKVTGDNK